VKNPGRVRSISAAHKRLWVKRSEIEVGILKVLSLFCC
jgi:hypothetical protein